MAFLRDDPVIVLGMHHSGTSLLAQTLHDHGVFMHANMEHCESRFFTVEVNDRAIMGGGGNWAADPIMPIDAVMAKLESARTLVEAKAARRYDAAGYDGVAPWGFKDPRTCVTLPLFLELFPRARVVHIVRDGDDVAASLARSKKSGVGVIADEAFWRRLWRQHVDRAREVGGRHHTYHELAYEALCQRPIHTLRPLFELLALPFSDATARYLKERVRPLSAV